MTQLAKGRVTQVFTKDLENGMMLGENVLNNVGNILLPKGLTVTEVYKVRRLLQQHNIILVKIFKPQTTGTLPIEEVPIEDTIDVPMPSNEERQIIKLVDDVNKHKERLKESFEKFAKGEPIQEKDIQKEVKNTLSLFKGNINVFQLMQKVKHLDDLTYSHCNNVALISYNIGQWLGLSQQDLQELALSGLLIDIGKIQICDSILSKNGKLTEDELIEIRKHSILSYELIKDYDFISDRVKKAVLFHHERMDGSGYPFKLMADKIPLFTRIVAISDVYNALISNRPYRKGKTPFEAIKVFQEEYMDKLDSNILYMFLNRISSYYIGQKVLLNNDAKGEIIFIPKNTLHRPIIKLETKDELVDLSKPQFKNLEIVSFC